MKYVIGIDGGGTKTRAVILNQDGQELGRGRAGAANPNTVGREATVAAMRNAVQTALMTAAHAAQNPPMLEEVAGLGVGVAGISNAQAWLDAMLAEVVPGAVVASTHDAEVALIGALGGRRGIVAIGGTGSTVYGVGAGGKTTLVDGWGYVLGDDASGFAIGQAGLRVFLRVCDGRAQPCALADAVDAALQLPSRDAIVAWAYLRDDAGRIRANVTGIADLARVVMDLAEAGDVLARAILDEKAYALVSSIGAAQRALTLGACEVGLVGGALRWGRPFAQAVIETLRDSLPDVTPVEPRSDAATGAAWLAMQRLGWRTL